MNSRKSGVLACAAALAALMAATACSAEEPKSEQPAQAQPAADATAPAPAADAATPAPAAGGDGQKMSPIDRVKATEKGKLKNPFPLTPEIIAEGKKLYLGNSCNGCHGGGGGGGMCPSLTNETWVYGSDDDTLFRLITRGSQNLQKEEGRTRIAKETVQGPMPGYETIITDEDKLWKIIAYVRSVYAGRAEKKNW